MPDRNINEIEVRAEDVVNESALGEMFLPRSQYDKRTIKHLIVFLGLSETDVVQAFGNIVSASQLREDMDKWGIRPRFFEGRSITGYYETQIAIYDEMIKEYQDGKFSAKYRDLAKIADKWQKEMQEVQSKLRQKRDDDEDDDDVDLTPIIEQNVSLLGFIKTQQKDQDQLIEIIKARGNMIKELANARKIEVEQVKIEEILQKVVNELISIGTKHNINGLAESFWTKVRVGIKGITGTDRNIFENPEIKRYIEEKRKGLKDPEERSKKRKKDASKKEKKTEPKKPSKAAGFIKQVREIQKKYGIHYLLAQRVQAEKNKDPNLSYEFLIEKYKPVIEEQYKHIFKKEINNEAKSKK